MNKNSGKNKIKILEKLPIKGVLWFIIIIWAITITLVDWSPFFNPFRDVYEANPPLAVLMLVTLLTFSSFLAIKLNLWLIEYFQKKKNKLVEYLYRFNLATLLLIVIPGLLLSLLWLILTSAH